jgi:hypothetical protein
VRRRTDGVRVRSEGMRFVNRTGMGMDGSLGSLYFAE